MIKRLSATPKPFSKGFMVYIKFTKVNSHNWNIDFPEFYYHK